MKRLLIIGAGGHGKVCADAALKMGKWSEIAYVDDAYIADSIIGFNVVGKISDLSSLVTKYNEAFVAIGDVEKRLKLYAKVKELGYSIDTILHPNAIIGLDVKIGEGTVLMAGSVINSSTAVGKACIINTGATIDHDCVLEDGVHMSPGAHLAGQVRVGERTWIGIGACVRSGILICENCIIGAGAAVVEDITEAGVYVGVPAKKR